MKRLNELFDIDNDMKIYSIHSDSRYVKPFSIFFCVEGLSVDGHQYVEDAIFQGAKVIVHSKELYHYQKDIIYIKVKDTLAELNRCANIFYDEASKHLKTIGVTGTNGKTCVTSMIKQSLDEYCKTGMIGTVSLEYDKVKQEMTFTTPATIDLHRYLYDMLHRDVKVVTMEVSSHGLALKRVDSIYFDIAIMTNIKREHLDFHGTFEQYLLSKRKLFEMLDEKGLAILNRDDISYESFRESTKARVMSYGIDQEADVMARNIQLSLNSTSFELYVKGNWYPVTTHLLAKFNVYNILALVCALVGIGCDEKMILSAVSKVGPAPGRMESVENKQGLKVIVDYCQYKDNFKDVLEFVSKVKPSYSKLIAVFGAPARKNLKNRSVLGNIANQYCDQVIITNQDDRGEDVFQIGKMIQSGMKKVPSVIVSNRQVAIEQAIEMASKDDVILILGKGHEQFVALDIGKEEYPGDKQVVIDAIERIYGKGE